MTRFAIGVDGGGTRTRAVIVDERGDEIGRAEARGAVVTATDPEAAANAVWDAVERAATSAGLEGPADVLWAGLSGAGRAEARAAVEDALARTRVADRIFVGTDVEAAFQDAFGSGPGIMIIAGTGSIAWARKADGEMVRTGGWGQHIGDEGGGYKIGLDALRRIARAEDGREPRTAMRDPILEYLGFTDPQQIVTWIGGAPKGEVAALVPHVSHAAARGDAAAAEVLEDAVDGLVQHVRTILERAGPWAERPELALWGGLIFQQGPLRGPLEQAIAPQRLTLMARELDPPLGAARLALAALEQGHDPG